MISHEESIPEKSQSYRIAEDIFYVQFNDISFFIEDDEQENFFFSILKKLFSNIRLEKIFPLGGKVNVINQAKKHEGDRSKIYIVDKDFDDILNKIKDHPNLFYLKRYSIENYLLEDVAIVNYVIGEKPRENRRKVENQINLKKIITEIGKVISDVVYLHLLVQKHQIGIKNVSKSCERFIEYDDGFKKKEQEINKYQKKITSTLKKIDGRYTLNAQLRKIKDQIDLNSFENYLINIPGKYLVIMVKHYTEREFNIRNSNIDSFNYRLAEKCELNTMTYLKEEISYYLDD